MPLAKYTACIMQRVAIILNMVLKYGLSFFTALSKDSARAFPDSTSISKPCATSIAMKSNTGIRIDQSGSSIQTWRCPAFTRGSKLVDGGWGCLLSIAQSGNSSTIFWATDIFANNMNSSTIELVSSIFFATTSTGSCVSLSTWNLISGDAKTSALQDSTNKKVFS